MKKDKSPIKFRAVSYDDRSLVDRLNQEFSPSRYNFSEIPKINAFKRRPRVYITRLSEVRLPLGLRSASAKLSKKGRWHFIIIAPHRVDNDIVPIFPYPTTKVIFWNSYNPAINEIQSLWNELSTILSNKKLN